MTTLLEKVTPETVLSSRPPTEPMERPCPPEQVEPDMVMLWSNGVSISTLPSKVSELLTVPELTATQSSWFITVAPVITTLLLEPISKPSVLCPSAPASPAELSIVIPVIVKPSAPLILTACTGVFLICKFVMLELVKECAAKNLGFVFPPFDPSPSQ